MHAKVKYYLCNDCEKNEMPWYGIHLYIPSMSMQETREYSESFYDRCCIAAVEAPKLTVKWESKILQLSAYSSIQLHNMHICIRN